ncbi:MAG: hypothetical protein RL885_20485 [Planctomycetota bacterium]
MSSSQTPAERLFALLYRQGIQTPSQPASSSELAEANDVAPLPEPLETLYRQVDLIRFGEVEPFQVADYIEVNEEREGLTELEEAVFVASDLSDGWFFVDPTGFLGLGPGFVFWVERGRLEADDCVPVATSLIELFEVAAAGETPWRSPMLGDRAIQRLLERLESSSAVATRAPLDPARLRAPEQIALPFRWARVLEHTNGFLLVRSNREAFGLFEIEALPGSGEEARLPGAIFVGRGPGGERYVSTTGLGWRGLPADRMLRVAAGQDPLEAPVLGRTADVWTRWILEDEEA